MKTYEVAVAQDTNEMLNVVKKFQIFQRCSKLKQKLIDVKAQQGLDLNLLWQLNFFIFLSFVEQI